MADKRSPSRTPRATVPDDAVGPAHAPRNQVQARPVRPPGEPRPQVEPLPVDPDEAARDIGNQLDKIRRRVLEAQRFLKKNTKP